MRVIIESPYAGATPELLDRNIRYLRACLRDSLLRGEAPFASHALYTLPGVLADSLPEERERGILAGFQWREVAALTAVYEDYGITEGMRRGILHARELGHVIEIRRIGGVA